MQQYVDASLRRVAQVRRIADELQHDERLHRLAMTAVFVLEDCHETFVRLSQQSQAADDADLLKKPANVDQR